MIDEKTPRRAYPLPYPENIASKDVERIATAISMIDTDVGESLAVVDAVEETVDLLKRQALRIPADKIGIINPTVTDLIPFNYLAVNESGTGFTTRAGSVGSGGSSGEILIKKSSRNFDTMWADPRSILKRAQRLKEAIEDCKCDSNTSIILRDEPETDNGEQLPRIGLTLKQITEDTEGTAFVLHIFQDEAEESPDVSEYATREKHGIVKIGHGFEVTNGVISVPDIPMASESVAGLVKIGENVEQVEGKISVEGAAPATHTSMGVVKLGEDFYLDEDKTLKLMRPDGFDEIIYQKARIQPAVDNVIAVKSTCAHYRIALSKDCTIVLDFSQIVQTADLSFDLEIISDGEYDINFEIKGAVANLVNPISFVKKGTTVVEFSKKIGFTALECLLKSETDYFSYLVPILTANEYTSVDGNLITSSSVEHNTYKRYNAFDRSLHTWFEMPETQEGWLQIELPRAKIANAFLIGSMDQNGGWFDGAPRTYSLLASNNESDWDTLFSIADSVAFRREELREHHFGNTIPYKFYRLQMSQSNRTSILIGRLDLLRTLDERI